MVAKVLHNTGSQTTSLVNYRVCSKKQLPKHKQGFIKRGISPLPEVDCKNLKFYDVKIKT